MIERMTSGKRPFVPVLLATVAFVVLGVLGGAWLERGEPFLVLGMMLVLGLPHGATDHGLFQVLRGGGPAAKNGFHGMYLGAIVTYGIVWYFLPLLAFGGFILLSAYHFGQSNWVSLRYRNGWVARLHYLIWGGGILLTPILLHAPDAIGIVRSMTGYEIPNPGGDVVTGAILVGAGINVAVILLLRLTSRIVRVGCGKR